MLISHNLMLMYLVKQLIKYIWYSNVIYSLMFLYSTALSAFGLTGKTLYLLTVWKFALLHYYQCGLSTRKTFQRV